MALHIHLCGKHLQSADGKFHVILPIPLKRRKTQTNEGRIENGIDCDPFPTDVHFQKIVEIGNGLPSKLRKDLGPRMNRKLTKIMLGKPTLHFIAQTLEKHLQKSMFTATCSFSSQKNILGTP